ncbi:MAG: D-alanine--D-alanine ligase [Ruminococcaceae bacterium]|nr:D-alanine--D-alanine ligase [Oscillospiraceae bacterium]
MKKLTLCVIFGGKTKEYEVSLNSAYEVLSHIDYEKYDVIRLGITKNGEWYIFEGENRDILNGKWEKGELIPVTLELSNGHLIAMEKHIYAINVDVFFPVTHGEYMEDGRLQGILEIADVKYVGTPSFASHICMDKALTKNVARQCGIPVAKDVLLDKNAQPRVNNLSFPVFVKPCMCGSSIGVSRVDEEAELDNALAVALGHCDRVLIEEAIDGDEVEVAVLERGGEILVSSVGMIKHTGAFYGYVEKYKSKSSECIIPAPINEKTEKFLRECAKKLFLALGCRSLSRFDFFVKANGKIVFNEVNTLPGFTKISMFPRLFMYDGLEYGEIIDALIKSAM